MAMEYKAVTDKLPPQYRTGGTMINLLVEGLIGLGELPERIGIDPTKLDLSHFSVEQLERLVDQIRETLALREAEFKQLLTPVEDILPTPEMIEDWELQIEALLRLGYHKALAMNEKAYRESIPSVQGQPDHFKGLLDELLLVDDRVETSRQCQLLRVSWSTDVWDLKEANAISNKDLRQLWAHGGDRFGKVKPKEAFDLFREFERGLAFGEGLALIRKKPELLDKGGINLLGSEKQELYHRVSYPQMHRKVDRRPNTTRLYGIGFISSNATARRSYTPSCGR